MSTTIENYKLTEHDWPGVMVLLVAVAALGLSIGPVWAIGIAGRRVDE